MSKLAKLSLLFVVGMVVLLIAITAALIYFVDADVYKSRLQIAVSEALGMEVSIDSVGVDLDPGIRFTMTGVRIRNQGKELVAVEKARIGLELISLLRDEVHVTSISLIRPKITIERSISGGYSFDVTQKGESSAPAVSLAKASIFNGKLFYVDKGSGGEIVADDCGLKLHNILLMGRSKDVIRDLSFTAKLHCGQVRTHGYTISDLSASVSANNGVFDFKPVNLEIFRGKGSGYIRADYSDSIPHYNVALDLPRFRIEDLLSTQSSAKVLEGPMDFSMNLLLQGKGVQQIRQSASGSVVIQGRNLKLHGHDLDLEFDRYESSQNFNLLDMGALFVAGPVGMAVTKGHDFANVLAGSGGVSDIRTFVSRWKVKRGVMHAQDVAMATNRHRMALLGSLDIAHSRFVDVTLALINSQGCAEVQQEISGPFERPVIQQPNILKSVAGPVLKLFKKGRKLLPGGGCKVIYSGAVAPPR